MSEGHNFKTMTVLVVDDVFNVRTMIKNMLRQMGFVNILEANSGPTAVEVLTKSVVDLVLCDWNMPGMKGVDVLRYVRKRPESSYLPFIMVTGEITEAVVAEAAESEVDAYLVKPFNMNQLRERIELVLQRHLEVSDIERQLSLGHAYVQTKQFDKARAAFKAALAINPNSPRTLFAIGKLYEEQGNDVQARKMYHRAVDIAPTFLKGHVALAHLYLALGDKEKHLDHLSKSVKISPRNLERKLMLGQSLLESGQGGEAKAILKEILDEASQHYSGIAERVGEALMAMGAYDVAEQAFIKALDANPGNLHLFNQLGMAYRRQGKFGDAIANYQRATTIAPQDENLWYNLARAYAEAGQRDQALRALKQSLEINPEFEEANNLVKLVTGKA